MQFLLVLIVLALGGMLVYFFYVTFIKKNTDVGTLSEADFVADAYGLNEDEKAKIANSAETIAVAFKTWPPKNFFDKINSNRWTEDEKTAVDEILKYKPLLGPVLQFYYAAYTGDKELKVDSRVLKHDCYQFLDGDDYDKVKHYFE